MFFAQLFGAILAFSLGQALDQATQCGLPPNLHELPDFAQDEIRAVWKDYQPGKKCDKEQLITEDILTVLEMFDKELERQGQIAPAAGKEARATPPHTAPTTRTPTRPTTTTRAELEYPDIGDLERAHLVPSSGRADVASVGVSAAPASSASTTSPTTVASTSHPTLRTSITTGFGPDYEEEVPPQSEREKPIIRPSKQARPHDFDYNASTGELTPRIDLAVAQEIKRPPKQRVLLTDYEEGKEADDEEGEETELRLSSRTHQQRGEKAPAQFEQFRATLPFLRGASPEVARVFQQVMDDPEIASERRRQEEIHLLAVSYLNARQLEAFNRWSTERRKRLRAQEQQLHLSAQGRQALRRLALAADVHKQRTELGRIAPDLRAELHHFAKRSKAEEEQLHRRFLVHPH